MKRIVKETLGSGKTQYRVETNRLLGCIPCKWYTDTYRMCTRSYEFIDVDAVFDTLEEAQLFAFGEIEATKIIKREIL